MLDFSSRMFNFFIRNRLWTHTAPTHPRHLEITLVFFNFAVVEICLSRWVLVTITIFKSFLPYEIKWIHRHRYG